MLSRFVLVALAMCGAVNGFAPSSVRMNRGLHPMQTSKGDGAIVVVNDDSVKSTVSVVGALAGFSVGGPLLAAVGAAGANYIANKENDFGETTKVAGKTVLMLYNLLLRANAELEVTDKIGAAIKTSVDNAKSGDSGEALAKAEAALEAALAKAADLDAEYGLVTQAKDLVVKAGDLSIEAIDKALKYAEENDVAGQLSEKAKELASKAKTA